MNLDKIEVHESDYYGSMTLGQLRNVCHRQHVLCMYYLHDMIDAKIFSLKGKVLGIEGVQLVDDWKIHSRFFKSLKLYNYHMNKLQQAQNLFFSKGGFE